MNKQNFKIKTSSKYRKDLKNLSAQDKEALNIVIKKLIIGDKLDPKYKDHSLSGELKGLRDCHIKPDLILIYKIDNNVLMLYLLRAGNHNNLQLSSLNKDNVYAQLKEARQQTALKSNGVYSVMNDSWIKEPVAEDIPEINQEEFDKLFTEWEDKYFDIKENPTKESIEDFIEDIYDLRKTSIANDGEYGLGNLVFKECRNLGYLDSLKEIKKDIVNKELSL